MLIGDVEIPLGFRQIHAVTLDAAGDVGTAGYIDLVASVDQVLRRSASRDATPVGATDGSSTRELSVADRRTLQPNSAGPARPTATVPRSYLYGALALALAFAAIAAWGRLTTARDEHAIDPSPPPAASGATAPPASDPSTPPLTPASTPGETGRGSSAVGASPTGATSSGIVVSGKGRQLYYVFDAAGNQQLGYSFTNTAIDLFPGEYVAVLNGVRLPLRVKHGVRTVLDSGSVTVSGTGATLFYVHDAAGKTQLGYAFTNASVEIFPGDYRVTLSGVSLPASVQPGRDTTIAAGRLTAPGAGSNLYYVYDAAGTKQLTYAFTNSELELLPGEYQVELNKVRRTARVAAGQKSVVDR